MLALVVALAVAAPTKSKPPPQPKPVAVDAGVAATSPLEQAGEVKEIELDEKRARAVYRIRTALTIPAVLEFPEPFAGEPACGDCATKPGTSSALFALAVDHPGQYLVLKPRAAPGLQPDGSNIPASDFVTTVTVRLASLTLTLQVELTEDVKAANPRVRFTLPGRAGESKFVADSVAKAKAALEADFAGRVEAAGGEQLLRGFLEPHECRVASTRQRTDDMVLELKELCRFGKRLYVRFALENRSRVLFVVGDLLVGTTDGKTVTQLPSRHLLSLQEVPFQASAEGVVSFDVDDPTAKSFELSLAEQGGRSRTVSLAGFGF